MDWDCGSWPVSSPRGPRAGGLRDDNPRQVPEVPANHGGMVDYYFLVGVTAERALVFAGGKILKSVGVLRYT